MWNSDCAAFEYVPGKCHQIFQHAPTLSSIISAKANIFEKGETFGLQSTFETIFNQTTLACDLNHHTEIDFVSTTAGPTVPNNKTSPWPLSVPFPIFGEDFEDLTDIELHNNPQQVVGKVGWGGQSNMSTKNQQLMNSIWVDIQGHKVLFVLTHKKQFLWTLLFFWWEMPYSLLATQVNGLK